MLLNGTEETVGRYKLNTRYYYLNPFFNHRIRRIKEES